MYIIRGLQRAARAIDWLNGTAGHVAGGLYYMLLLLIIVHVVLRYVFNLNLVELEELHWHFYSAAFLLGLGYAYLKEAHVRIDLFYERMDQRGKAWVELLGVLFLLLPFCLLIGYFAADYFWKSWKVREASDMVGGLPARYILKFILFLSLILLTLQALAALQRALMVIFGSSDRRD